MTSAENRSRAAKPGPGRIVYLAALLPLMVGFVVMGAVLATQLPKMNAGLEQIVVPGARELTLEPGTHTVFLETRSVVDGRAYAVDAVPGLQIRVEGVDGSQVSVNDPMGSSTYSLGGRQGHSIGSFRIDQAGTYRVGADYAGGDGPQAVIAVGQGFVGALLIAVFSSLGAVFLGMGLTIAAGVWVFLKRRRAKRLA